MEKRLGRGLTFRPDGPVEVKIRLDGLGQGQSDALCQALETGIKRALADEDKKRAFEAWRKKRKEGRAV